MDVLTRRERELNPKRDNQGDQESGRLNSTLRRDRKDPEIERPSHSIWYYKESEGIVCSVKESNIYTTQTHKKPSVGQPRRRDFLN